MLTFSKGEVILLTGLTTTQLRNLRGENIVGEAEFDSGKFVKPAQFSWASVVLLTIHRSLLELFSRDRAIDMVRQIKLAINFLALKNNTVDSFDCFFFEGWNNFKFRAASLPSLEEWFQNRWVIRIISRSCTLYPDNKREGPIGSVKISNSGEYLVENQLHESLVCIYIRGIFERIKLAAFQCAELSYKIQELTQIW